MLDADEGKRSIMNSSASIDVKEELNDLIQVDSEDDHVVEVDPLVFCQPEISSPSTILAANAEEKSRRTRIWEHPVELKRFLTGDLASELSITVTRPAVSKQQPPLRPDKLEACVLTPGDFESSSGLHRFVTLKADNETPLRQHGDEEIAWPGDITEDEDGLLEEQDNFSHWKYEESGSISPNFSAVDQGTGFSHHETTTRSLERKLASSQSAVSREPQDSIVPNFVQIHPVVWPSMEDKDFSEEQRGALHS